MAERPRDPTRGDPHRTPDSGTEAASDATTEGVDARVVPEDDEVERIAETSTGPGAGENELVKVTTPRRTQDKDIPTHPTLRNE